VRPGWEDPSSTIDPGQAQQTAIRGAKRPCDRRRVRDCGAPRMTARSLTGGSIADGMELDHGTYRLDKTTPPNDRDQSSRPIGGWSGMMLECPGVFLAPFVPEGWTASGTPGEFYELVPPEGSGAIHISVYRRPELPIQQGEARDMLAAFLAEGIQAASNEIRVISEGRGQQRAFSQLIHPNEDGELTQWFAACIIWPKHMLICTYNSPSGDGDLPAAERMFASICPSQPS
jgi:hypothetical protein